VRVKSTRIPVEQRTRENSAAPRVRQVCKALTRDPQHLRPLRTRSLPNLFEMNSLMCGTSLDEICRHAHTTKAKAIVSEFIERSDMSIENFEAALPQLI